jgi:hypothetical protein
MSSRRLLREHSCRERGCRDWSWWAGRLRRRFAPSVAAFRAVEQLALLGGVDVEYVVGGARWTQRPPLPSRVSRRAYRRRFVVKIIRHAIQASDEIRGRDDSRHWSMVGEVSRGGVCKTAQGLTFGMPSRTEGLVYVGDSGT